MELRIDKGSDICLAIVGLMLGPFELCGSLFFAWRLFPVIADGLMAGDPLALTKNAWLLAAITLGCGWVGVSLLFTGVGAAWRLADRGPAVVADRYGLRFHPSISKSPAAWSDVVGVTLVSQRFTQLRVDLAPRIWSPLLWTTGTSIRLNLRALGLSVKDGRDVVRRMKSLAPHPLPGRRRRKPRRLPRRIDDAVH